MSYPLAAPNPRLLFSFFPLLPLLLSGAALREGPDTLASVMFARGVHVSVRNEGSGADGAALACPAGLRVRLTPVGALGALGAQSVASPAVAPGQTWSSPANRTFAYGGEVRIEAWCRDRSGEQGYVRVDERVYRLTPNAGVIVRLPSAKEPCAGLAEVVEGRGPRPCVDLSYH